MIYLINKQNFRTEGILEKRGVCADQCPWNPLPIYRTPRHRCALHLEDITDNKQCNACKEYTKDHKRAQ